MALSLIGNPETDRVKGSQSLPSKGEFSPDIRAWFVLKVAERGEAVSAPVPLFAGQSACVFRSFPRRTFLELIMEEAFLADGLHTEESGRAGFREEGSRGTCEGGGLGAAENAGRPSEVKFVDGVDGQQSPKEGWSPFTDEGAETIVAMQDG